MEIDQRKHDIDVLERVLSAARGIPDESSPGAVVAVGIRTWILRSDTTAVGAAAGEKDEEGSAKPRPSHDDEYESDRRGEHSYPRDDEREPPSHRERDDFKSRLERRG